jgi:hypothetical protein
MLAWSPISWYVKMVRRVRMLKETVDAPGIRETGIVVRVQMIAIMKLCILVE